MKQAISLTPAQREALYLELAPTDIEAMPVVMPEQHPIQSPEKKPSGTLTREQLTAKIKADYQRELEYQQAKEAQVSRSAFTLLAVKCSALTVGGVLAYNVITAFNPVAFGVTAAVVGVVGLWTYPGRAKEEKPTWIPKDSTPVKTQVANVNPVINVTINTIQQ